MSRSQVSHPHSFTKVNHGSEGKELKTLHAMMGLLGAQVMPLLCGLAHCAEASPAKVYFTWYSKDQSRMKRGVMTT